MLTDAWLFLSRLLGLVVQPLGLVLMLSVLACLALALTRRRLATMLASAAGIILLIASLPVVSEMAYSTLEDLHPPLSIPATHRADVAIVLGGGLHDRSAPRTEIELTYSSSRFLHAFRLYRAGKVDRIIVAGGMPSTLGLLRPEAEAVSELLEFWGVPRDKIEIETDSRNTWENARGIHAVRERRPFSSALLVTSALHMPRAVGVFRRMGIPVVASSADIRVVKARPKGLLYWVPNAEALSMTSDAIREWFGIMVYRLRGWM